jgi:WD40 repeat protein
MKSNARHQWILLAPTLFVVLASLCTCASSAAPQAGGQPSGQPQGRLAGPYAAPTSEPTIKVQTVIANWITCISFTPDGKRIVTGSNDLSVRVWDAVSGKELRYFEGHSGRVRDLGISRDGRLAVTAGMWDGTARLWDLETGLELHVFNLKGKTVPTAGSPARAGRAACRGCQS